MKALTEHMRRKSGDDSGWAAKVCMLATEDTKAASVDGTAGPQRVVTTDMVPGTFKHSAKRGDQPWAGCDNL